MNNFRSTVSTWFRNNVDFAFFLAAFTETPRWTVAFMAVHEPTWVGVPLGVLLAFATARAWRKYFENRDWRLFAFNVLSIVIAVAVIAPVLFAMTSVPASEVNLSAVLPTNLLWGWSIVLALTTFIPLVQLAAVQQSEQNPNNRTKSEQPKRVVRTVRDTHTIEQSEQFTVAAPVQIAQSEQPVLDLPANTEAQKRAQLANILQNNPAPNKSKLAKELGIGRTTLYAWMEELAPQT